VWIVVIVIALPLSWLVFNAVLGFAFSLGD
jgi:hypothetical protein